MFRSIKAWGLALDWTRLDHLRGQTLRAQVEMGLSSSRFISTGLIGFDDIGLDWTTVAWMGCYRIGCFCNITTPAFPMDGSGSADIGLVRLGWGGGLDWIGGGALERPWYRDITPIGSRVPSWSWRCKFSKFKMCKCLFTSDWIHSHALLQIKVVIGLWHYTSNSFAYRCWSFSAWWAHMIAVGAWGSWTWSRWSSLRKSRRKCAGWQALSQSVEARIPRLQIHP